MKTLEVNSLQVSEQIRRKEKASGAGKRRRLELATSPVNWQGYAKPMEILQR